MYWLRFLRSALPEILGNGNRWKSYAERIKKSWRRYLWIKNTKTRLQSRGGWFLSGSDNLYRWIILADKKNNTREHNFRIRSVPPSKLNEVHICIEGGTSLFPRELSSAQRVECSDHANSLRMVHKIGPLALLLCYSYQRKFGKKQEELK